MSYDVLDVCHYIIDYSNKKDYGISNLKLQKILYFVQAYFLINEPSRLCFDDKIEAWNFGPVVPRAYRAYKQFAGCDIPSIARIKGANKNTNITDEDKELINAVIDKFADYSATDLVDLTHKQSPWIDAYASRINGEITPEAIKEYFDD